MPELLTRPRTVNRLPTGDRRGAVMVGAVAALWAAGAGALWGTVLAWAVRAIAGDGTNLPATVGSGLAGWLYAHGAGVTTQAGRIALTPMGFLLLVGWLVFRGVRSGVYGASLTRGRALVVVATVATGTYSTLVALTVTAVRFFGGPRVGSWPAVAGAFALSAAVAPIGALSGSGRKPPDAVRRLTSQLGRQAGDDWARGSLTDSAGRAAPYARTAGRAGVAGLAILVAGGASLFATAQIAHLGRSGRLFEGLAGGNGDLLTMLALCLVLVPNAVVFGLAYAVGTGFAVGTGTAVTPWTTYLGAAPAVPILGALPDAAVPPRAMALVLLIPVAAGVVAGAVVLRRHQDIVLRTGTLTALGAAGIAGAAVFALTLVAGGSLGSGRLAAVGPSPWRTAVAAGLEVGLAAVATVIVRTVAHRHRATPVAPPRSASPVSPG